MNGGGSSLGLRSSSYGSLQQLVPLQIQISKTPSKMTREKERVLSRICKFAIAGRRRRVGMLLLLIASVAIFCSLFSFTTKDDRTTPGIGTVIPNPIRLHESTVNTSTKPTRTLIQKTPLIPVPVSDPSQLFTQHPCANFSFTPPPLNLKRTGPRPCQVCYISVQQAMSLVPISPIPSAVLKELNFVSEENLVERESSTGGSVFGGYPSLLLERDQSFHIKDFMNVHCGFVRGKRPGQNIGFDIDIVRSFRNGAVQRRSCRLSNFRELRYTAAAEKHVHTIIIVTPQNLNIGFEADNRRSHNYKASSHSFTQI